MLYTAAAKDATSSNTQITPPTGINAGDLVLLLMSKDGTGAFTTPSGWTLLGGMSGGANYLSVFYQFASGEIETFFVSHASEPTTWICVVIPDALTPVISSGAGATSSTPNPDALTSGFSEGTVTTWITLAGWDYNRSLISYPSGYDENRISLRNSSTGGCGIAMATKDSSEATEDPGNFVISASDQNAAYTIAIRYAPYVTSGTYISSAIATDTFPAGSRLKFEATIPSGTSITIEYACSNNNVTVPETGWITIENEEVFNFSDDYVWIKITLETENTQNSPVVSALWIEEETADPNKIQINLTYAGRMKHPQGDVSVNFTGTLLGVGGSIVDPFLLSFIPQDLLLFFHPNDPEYVEITGTSISATLYEVTYKFGQSDDEFCMITNAGIISSVLTHIDDIET